MDNETLKKLVVELQTKVKNLEANFSKHQHDGIDGTNTLRKNIKLDQDQYLQVGLGGHGTAEVTGLGTTGEQIQYAISVGKDDGRTGFVNKADVMQMNFLHQPRNTSKQSFLTMFRTPVVSPLQGTSISTTLGDNTVTIAGYNFTTNELSSALIDIYNSSGSLVETQTIASNTSTVVTISGTWGASTSGGTFFIYMPVFMGSADYIYQRFYTQEGTTGGIRFGVGATAGALNQNGLLYMDSAGDLYWRNKAGTATKIFQSASTPLAGTKVYYVSDTSGGLVTRKLTFTNGILTSES
jgi:hypothetical protein